MSSPFKVLPASSVNWTLIWNDRGSGAAKDGSVWRATPPNGYANVGDLFKVGHGHPKELKTRKVLFIKDDPQHAIKPTGYIQKWKDSGSGAKKDFSSWQPKAPPGFMALGDVGQGNYSQPSVNVMRVVKKAYVKQLQTQPLLSWDDRKSGARTDFGAWYNSPYHTYYSCRGKLGTQRYVYHQSICSTAYGNWQWDTNFQPPKAKPTGPTGPATSPGDPPPTTDSATTTGPDGEAESGMGTWLVLGAAAAGAAWYLSRPPARPRMAGPPPPRR